MAQKKHSMVVVFSGGMDSTVLLYRALQDYNVSSAVSFNYGQRHSKELEYAKRTCEELNLKHHIIDLSQSGITEALSQSGSSLIDMTSSVPDGHYAEENMKSTVVPNRNMIMLSIALGIAVSEGAQAVATGVHAGDHFIYPDCRPSFLLATALAGYLGNEGFGKLWRSPVWAPFVHKTKADIAFTGFEIGVPFEKTWSCYKGGEKHCGRCGTCVERLEAIHEALERVIELQKSGSWGPILPADQTQYEDEEFWIKSTDGSISL